MDRNITTDLVARLEDLHKQAIIERSHFYVASCCVEAIVEITRLRAKIERVERLAAGNITGCGTCSTILKEFPADVGGKHGD